MKEELEIMRRYVTPAKFLADVRYQIRKHGLTTIDPGDITLDYFATGENYSFHNKTDDIDELFTSKPYEYQSYIRDELGVLNTIMEFDFWDDKTGTGYFYFVNTRD